MSKDDVSDRVTPIQNSSHPLSVSKALHLLKSVEDKTCLVLPQSTQNLVKYICLKHATCKRKTTGSVIASNGYAMAYIIYLEADQVSLRPTFPPTTENLENMHFALSEQYSLTEYWCTTWETNLDC